MTRGRGLPGGSGGLRCLITIAWKAAQWRKVQLEAKANIDEHEHEHANQAYLEHGGSWCQS